MLNIYIYCVKIYNVTQKCLLLFIYVVCYLLTRFQLQFYYFLTILVNCTLSFDNHAWLYIMFIILSLQEVASFACGTYHYVAKKARTRGNSFNCKIQNVLPKFLTLSSNTNINMINEKETSNQNINIKHQVVQA